MKWSHTVRKSVLLAGLSSFALHAQAQLYGRLDVGYSKALDAGITDVDATRGLICADSACNNTGGTLEDVGKSVVLSAGVGWRIGPSLRAELAAGYRGGYKLDDIDAFGTQITGDVTSLSVMVNGYYDFGANAVKPYVGIGIGIARNKMSDVRGVNASIPGVYSQAPDQSKTGLAWRLAFGISYDLADNRALDVALSYMDLGKIAFGAGDVLSQPGNAVGLSGYAGAEGSLKVIELAVGIRF